MSVTPAATPDSATPNPCGGIRDVADFHLRWPEFRDLAQGLAANPALSETEQDLVVWMVALLDRIGPKDVETEAD